MPPKSNTVSSTTPRAIPVGNHVENFRPEIPNSAEIPKVRRFSDRNNLQSLTELNVTPLLDLAFVLLIIFMITTPLIENSLDLVVPTSTTAQNPVDPTDVQIVAIDRNNIIKLNEVEITPENLETELAQLKATLPNIAVVVRPDRDLAIQRFISVMDILQRVGITKVGVMTRPEDAANAPSSALPAPPSAP